MAIIQDGQNLLNDLFTNNIDFVAKQLQTIVDALFPNNEDNNETPINVHPYIVTGQCCSGFGGYGFNGVWRDVHGLYNVNFSSLNSESYITYVAPFGDDSDINAFNNIVSDNAGKYHIQLSSNNVGHNIGLNTTWNPAPVWDFDLSSRCSSVFTNDRQNTQNSGYTQFSFVTYNPDYSPIDSFQYTTTACPTIMLWSFGDSGTKNFVVTDSDDFTNVYNNINYNNDYHTYNTYTFDGGSVTVGGGAGGIVVGLGGAVGYADIKFALDSLIDDLNLNLGGNNKLPVTEFPSYYDIKYEDMGSFYITPIKQIPTLPVAPDLADTVIDISEPVGVLTDGFDGLLGAFDALGITLMVSFTFIARLCIRKLRGE